MHTQADISRRDVLTMAGRHGRLAWWMLLGYLSVGILLEALHGFKIAWYLGTDVETRRLMWTLGHAHGTLLALINAAFAAAIIHLCPRITTACRWASPCLISASVLLPCGFLLGGVFIHSGDPGIAIVLVPLGAALLWIGILLTALAVSQSQPNP